MILNRMSVPLSMLAYSLTQKNVSVSPPNCIANSNKRVNPQRYSTVPLHLLANEPLMIPLSFTRKGFHTS